MAKRFLFVVTKPLLTMTAVQEILDTLLIVAAFDQPVSLLFLDQAVFLIKKNPLPNGLETGCTTELFACLPLYEINDVYVEDESLQELGLTATELSLPVSVCRRDEINALWSRFDVIYSFS